MNRDYFWLTKAQFARLKPLLPTDTRGKPRVDDRRVISGIVHVLKSGGRWIDAPAIYGPRKTLYNRFVRWAAKGVWINIFRALAVAGGPPAQVLIDSSAVKAHRCASGGKGGERNQAIGRSRGGRTTKIRLLLEQMRHASILHGDKGYDSNVIRRRIEGKGVMTNIPPKANRRWKNCFSPFLYRKRNAIERKFCRLKDFRRIATRYDRLATNYLAAVCLAAAVSYWL